MSYLSDLLGTAYKEGMTEEEISTALETAGIGKQQESPAPPADEIEKLRRRLSEVNSEAAGYKKQLRSLQGAEQAAAEEQKEAMETLQRENQELRRSMALADKKASLISQGYDEDLAVSTATAMVDGDMDTVLKNMQTRAEALKREVTAENLRNTPRPPAGASSSGNDYSAKIEQARNENNYAALAYYTRLQAQDAQQATT